jgi:hypothetical protein
MRWRSRRGRRRSKQTTKTTNKEAVENSNLTRPTLAIVFTRPFLPIALQSIRLDAPLPKAASFSLRSEAQRTRQSLAAAEVGERAFSAQAGLGLWECNLF